MKQNNKYELLTLLSMHKKTILSILLAVLCIIGAICAIYIPEAKINNVIDTTQDIILQELVVSEQTEELAIQTKEATNKDEELQTTETIESSIEEEQNIEEENIEVDAIVEQENIAYNGDITGKGTSLLGKCTGLTYYSQADSRWANVMYSSTGNSSQTIKSSGCGATTSAIVVSSSKGAILPTTMASLFVDNGYRTANSGTAWSAFSFVADYFDFDEFYTTSDYDTMLSYLKKGYYVIASCGSGLFTSGGHYIVLVADENSTITVYDPYLYSGKFNTASRKKANVTVDGNSVYVSETNFKKYANYKNFWIFSNDYIETKTTAKTTNKEITKTTKKSTNKTKYVKVSSYLNVRKGAGTSYKVISTLKNGAKVTVYETKNGFSRIGKNKWVKSKYLTSTKPVTYSTTVNKTYKLSQKCTLYSKSNLSGTKYKYKKNTKVKVLKHISTSVDYVYVLATKRKAYIKSKYLE